MHTETRKPRRVAPARSQLLRNVSQPRRYSHASTAGKASSLDVAGDHADDVAWLKRQRVWYARGIDEAQRTLMTFDEARGASLTTWCPGQVELWLDTLPGVAAGYVSLEGCFGKAHGTLAAWARRIVDRLRTHSEIEDNDLLTLTFLLVADERVADRSEGAIDLVTLSSSSFAWPGDDVRIVPRDDLDWLLDEVAP